MLSPQSFTPGVATDADDLTPYQTESLLYSLVQVARNINLYVNSNKTEFVYFNQDSTISLLNVEPLKLIEQFINLGRNISSIESDVNIHINNA